MSAQLSVCRHDGCVSFRVAGRATMRESPAVRCLAEECLAAGAGLRFELDGCIWMDSTFLGTLLCLLRAAQRAGSRLSLVNPSDECLRLLRQMRIAPMFLIVSEGALAGPWDCLPTGSEEYHFRRTVAEAHLELADLPGPEGAQFRALASRMAAELAAARS
jgi:anti-anti-sigma factor